MLPKGTDQQNYKMNSFHIKNIEKKKSNSFKDSSWKPITSQQMIPRLARTVFISI